jgi:hypothetical protein
VIFQSFPSQVWMRIRNNVSEPLDLTHEGGVLLERNVSPPFGIDLIVRRLCPSSLKKEAPILCRVQRFVWLALLHHQYRRI